MSDLTTMHAYARAAHDAGLRVLPPKQDGSKAPDTRSWKDAQETFTTPEELIAWYGDGRRSGIGIVVGKVSGNLEVLEFDDWEAYERFVELAYAAGLNELVERIEDGYHEFTPNGVHWLYRCPEIEGNQKLAERISSDGEIKALIETRGQGGYVIVAPTYGSVHPTKKAYKFGSEDGVYSEIVTITPEERLDLFSLARSMDERPRRAEATPARSTRTPRLPGDGEQPGEFFNRTTTWAEVLTPHGWTQLFTHGSETYWRRPGKDRGQSATTNYADTDLLKVFTSSTSFDTARTYSKFGAFAHLNHGDDFGAAARAIRGTMPRAERAPQPGAAAARTVEKAASAQRTDLSNPPTADDSWPVIDPVAYRGVLAEVISAIEPHTEADSVGLLANFLAAIGNAVGAGPHALADGSKHPGRLNVVTVGTTSRGRKGTAWSNVRRVMAGADDEWTRKRIMSGLASGEGLIATVADPIETDDGKKVGGSNDHRLCVVEPEFARVLNVSGRDGNTLSAVMRQAWDDGQMHVMTRKDPLHASNAHVTLIAQITVEELRKNLAAIETANGFANRLLFLMVKRSKLLPSGGSLDEGDFLRFGRLIRTCIEKARGVHRITRSTAAEKLWAQRYGELAHEEHGGLVGAVTARAEANLLRLSVLYALLDGSAIVEVEHLEAAWAVWRYATDSAVYIFGDNTGDEVADKLLAALQQAGAAGLSATEQQGLFGRHKDSNHLERVRNYLEEQELIVTEKIQTGGRPVTRSFCIDAYKAKEAN